MCARMPVMVSPWPSSAKETSSFRRSHTLMVLSMPPVYTCGCHIIASSAIFLYAQSEFCSTNGVVVTGRGAADYLIAGVRKGHRADLVLFRQCLHRSLHPHIPHLPGLWHAGDYAGIPVRPSVGIACVGTPLP